MGNPDKIVAVGLGEVLYDHDVVTDEYTFGGAPANFADHFLKCSRLISGPDAAEVHVVSAVGDDERGRAVSAELEARGLCDGLCRVGELPTGVVDKRRDAAGVNAYEILPGAWDAMTWSDALARLAARTDVVCFGSLAQRSAASHATVVRFLDGVIRRERPTLRVFDVNLRQDFFSREVLEESMARCNILKISDEEAPRVAGCLTGCPDADAGGLCRELLDRRKNLEMVILTEGAEGSRVFTRNRISAYVIPRGERVRPVDTVGAGDSFTAAFCAMLAAGYDIWPAQAFASKVAAFVCSCAGATPEYPAAAKTEFSGNL